jgi:hypothetical protein
MSSKKLPVCSQNRILSEITELSPRTFCIFPREFSSFGRQGAANGHRSYLLTDILHLPARVAVIQAARSC